MPLLTVENLRTRFHTRNGIVRAVDGVSFHVNEGETLGIAGESGSGKSVTALSLLGLVPSPPARIEAEAARFGAIDLVRAPRGVLRSVRGRSIAMVFQDPMTALNPYMTIGAQVIEPLRVHEGVPKAEARDRAIAALREVGLHEAGQRFNDYPHEFSGGMRQRVMIAMALIAKPRLLIADEPTTALDVTVQAQILELIAGLQRERKMSVMLITHDLGVIASVCERVLVMYAGAIMESGPVREVFREPRHPYTAALMKAIPGTRRKGEELYTIPGSPPDLAQPIEGCPFAPRCAHAAEVCRAGRVALRDIAPGRGSACIRVQEGQL